MAIPAQFVGQNPWWRDIDAFQKDNDLVRLADSAVQWEPRIKFQFTWFKDAIYTMRGPRQIGKTTLVKCLIRDLVSQRRVNPRLVFYHTCDLIDGPGKLSELVSSYIDPIRQDFEKDRLYIFLDEVSSIPDWQKGIKHLADVGKLANCTFVLTGSHSIDVKKASENLTGRRGNVNDVLDKIILPMKFAEYVETRNQKLRDAVLNLGLRPRQVRYSCVDKLLSGSIPDEIKELNLYSKEFELLFNDYLLTGGVPRAIDEYVKTSGLNETTYKIYVDSVLGDLSRWGKKEIYLRQIISRICETIGTCVSWNALRNNTDVASHATVADYIDLLCSAFVLTTVYQINLTKGSAAFEKDKKIHFEDPFIFHALHAWSSARNPFDISLELIHDSQKMGSIVEGIVANHLTRYAFGLSDQKQFFDPTSLLFYWKSDKQREVDFILKLDSRRFAPFEVKYQGQISRRDKLGIFDFQKTGNSTQSGIILSKRTLSASDRVTVLPVWLFLLLI
jgi:predicted AAA+ superfamily ATPase